MSTDAIPTPPSPPPSPEPVVELIRTQRQNVGYLLTFLAVVFLVGGVMMVVKSNDLSKSAATTDKTKDGKDRDPDDPLASLSGGTAELSQSKRFDYLVGAFGMALGLVVAGSGAAYLIVGLPKPTETEGRREARVFVLTVGGLLGLFLIIIGVWFFIRWSDSLVNWLDKNETKEAKYALYPILMIAGGGLLMLLATQPARAEERNNTAIRRLVYGSNFALTVLTLFVVLVIVNAVVAMRVPNKLDTTGDAFYTLNAQTRQFLEQMSQPIRAYAIFQDGSPITADTKRLLDQAREVNPKFQVRHLSPALNRDEITKLKSDYPLAEMSSEGVLLVAGEEGAADRKRHTFIRADEFASEKAGEGGQSVTTFNGEPKLLRELMFLAEDKKKPKVYFTQSSGELSLAPAGGDARRTASQLKSYLEKNYFDVAPLTFELGTVAKVPDDATVVIVADPTAPVPPAGVEAIRKFMTDPRPDGSKGKLVVLAGAQPGPDRKPLKLGLEPVLAPFGAQPADKFVYGVPSNQLPDPRRLIAGITRESVEANNPVALGFANNLEQVTLIDCREVIKSPAGAMQSVTVLASVPGPPTWTQPEFAPNPRQAWQTLLERAAAAENAKTDAEAKALVEAFDRDYQISKGRRTLAVFVSERDKDKEVARVAVFGNGWFVSDDASAQAGRMGGARGSTLLLDLMGSTLDWARDRPVVLGVQEKEYTQYTIKPGYDRSRLIYVPLGIGLLIVLGLGAGVWVVRRK